MVPSKPQRNGAKALKIGTVIAIAAATALSVRAQPAAQAAVTGPLFVPLFTISWNITENVVHYDAKLTAGTFDPKEPIIAYWVMNQTDGHREPLTFIERLKGYGFRVQRGAEPDSWDMVIVSVKKKTLHIKRAGEQFEVTLSIANCPVARLDSARVHAHKWHMITIADYVDMTGTDVRTGEQCRERVMQGE